jgi:hypothetical protein
VRVQGSTHEQSDGHAAHRAGQPGRAGDPVRSLPSPTAPGRAPSPGCGLSGGGVGCRGLRTNSLTGPLPTQLGTMNALGTLCVHRPHPPPSPTMDAGRVQTAERREVGLVASQWRSYLSTGEDVHALCLNRSQGSVSHLCNPGAAMVLTAAGCGDADISTPTRGCAARWCP